VVVFVTHFTAEILIVWQEVSRPLSLILIRPDGAEKKPSVHYDAWDEAMKPMFLL